MDTKEKLQTALKDAMRSGDDVAKRTIRMALANVKQSEIDNRKNLDEAGVIAILQKEVKNRNEAVQDAVKANRPDLVTENQAEIAVIERFLPKQLSQEELIAEARAVIAELQAVSPADMGKVMKVLRPRLEGKASGEAISQVVRSLLSGG